MHTIPQQIPSWSYEALWRVLGLALAACLLLAPGTGSVSAGAAQEQPPGHPEEEARDPHLVLRIAVVNVDRVFEDCEEWEDVRDQLRRLREKAASTLRKYERQIRLLRSEYENLPPGTELADRKRDEIQSALEEYQQSRGEFEERLSRRRTQAISAMLRRIDAEVRGYALENDIDLVLKAGEVRLIPEADPELSSAALRRAAIADVLYARQRYDISEEIVHRLNADYPGEIVEPPQK